MNHLHRNYYDSKYGMSQRLPDIMLSVLSPTSLSEQTQESRSWKLPLQGPKPVYKV
jgi:hypothetical protein